MLEKTKGNFNVTKLHIILLFKVDFNQLNKFTGKEMMQQAESLRLVADLPSSTPTPMAIGTPYGCSF